MKGSLKGKTVIVTRPRLQARALERELRLEGARVVLTSLIRIAPPSSYSGLDRALRDLVGYDAAVFTSANAVDRFFARCRALKIKNPPQPRFLWAVGPATASRLARHGWRKAKVASAQHAGGLLASMGEVKGLRILLPRAQRGREILPRELRRRGAEVSLVEAYRTLPDAQGLERLENELSRRAVDAVIFASPSAVEQFASRLGPGACRRIFKAAVAVSIGPATSAALAVRGIRAGVESSQASARALVRALRDFYLEKRP
ncbi:MAG: uroporphyrinogen-III synthase [Elusimicrobia bacterium]|nr:uroporphyrinogen-III synthase [Elusimicrobiota bacterium]